MNFGSNIAKLHQSINHREKEVVDNNNRMSQSEDNKNRALSWLFDIVSIVSIVIIALLLRSQLTNLRRTTVTHSEVLSGLKEKYGLINSNLEQISANEKLLNKRLVKMLEDKIEKMQNKVDMIEKNMKAELAVIPVSQEDLKGLTITQRVKRIEMMFSDQTIIIDLLENMAKEIVRETKIKKYEEIAKQDYFKDKKKKTAWTLQRGNIRTPYMSVMQKRQIQKLQAKEQARLEGIYHMSSYERQLPFCIIVPSYNNAKNFRFEYNIQSILNQKYQNYHVVIVDDASTDNTGLLIKRFLQNHKIGEEKVRVVINKKKMTAVPNIHFSITKYCRPDEIGFFVDGDDEVLGRSTFKMFNAIYQSRKPSIAYSISLQYWVFDNFVKDGWSQAYTSEEKLKNLYRDVPQKISHLRSFRIDLYLQIDEKDLKDANGQWLLSTYDEVICLPMLEMSCGNIQFIQEYNYLYVYGTGFNDRQVDENLQYSIAQYIKKQKPKYQCKKKYGKK